MNGKEFLHIFETIGQHKDIFLAVLLVGIVFMMILPMPTAVVDVLIALNIGISITMLMLAIYISSPLEFSSFPAVLLLTTLFRLALSVTTTRLILLQADAGEIVTAFGNFVVGGNLVVGIVVFLIITIVQFMVITKGSERVAEVGARFSLDAMPGKQMSIDGDMRAGVIEMEEASRRRSIVEKESQLYGSMDGAMKFVKGDAIAGLIIIVVNILGGVGIGVSQRGLSTGEALEVYAILTVGDGLISQIPALLISITAGFIVTRVTQEESKDLGNDIGLQIVSKPKALLIAAGILFLFGIIPGFPMLTCFCLSAMLGGLGFWLFKKSIQNSDFPELPNCTIESADEKPLNNIRTAGDGFSMTMPLLVEVDSKLEKYIDKHQLNEELLAVRRALYMDLGAPFPGIHLRFTGQLNVNEYRILLHEVPIVSGLLKESAVLVLGQREKLEIAGFTFVEDDKIFHPRKAYWVDLEHKDKLAGLSVVCFEPTQIMTFQLSQILKKYAEDFVGIQETRYLLQNMEEKYGELVREAQRILPIQRITEIFKRLVAEGVSIRNLRLILEAIVEWGVKEKDTVILVEYIRTSLKRQISYKFSNGQNILPVYLLDADLEEKIRGAIRQTSAGAYLALEPNVSARFVQNVKEVVGNITEMTTRPVLLSSMDIRRYVRKLIEMDLNELSVLSHQDLTPEITVQPLGRIDL